MANLHQQLIGARRALLILGWALVIAEVALAFEQNVRAKFNVAPLADRVQSFDDEALAGFVNAPARDGRGRDGFAPNQIIVRFREGVTVERCRGVMSTQGTKPVRVLDPYRSLYLVELAPPLSVTGAINQFVVRPEVDYAVPNVWCYTN